MVLSDRPINGLEAGSRKQEVGVHVKRRMPNTWFPHMMVNQKPLRMRLEKKSFVSFLDLLLT